jgi:hypothetical protein
MRVMAGAASWTYCAAALADACEDDAEGTVDELSGTRTGEPPEQAPTASAPVSASATTSPRRRRSSSITWRP